MVSLPHLFCPFFVGAESNDIVINEIMYNPAGTDTGLEWIELYNRGAELVDLTGWDLYPDGIGYYTFGSFSLAPGKFVVIHLRLDGIDTATDLYQGTSPQSNMGNTKGSVALFNSTSHSSDTIVDFVQYGAGGETWQSAATKAGIWTENDFIITAIEGNSIGLKVDGQDSNSSSDWQEFSYLEEPSEEKLETPEQPMTAPLAGVENNPPQAQVGEDKIALVGQVIEFDGSLSSDPDNDPLTFVWNFGHGRTAEGVKATSTYQYAGEYIVTLKASDGSLEDIDQISVTIYLTKILVSEFLANPVGKDEEGEWIEIYNPSDFWVDLSEWQLDDTEAGSKPFIIPANTFLPPKNYLVFSRQITKIALNNDQDEVRILFPNGEISDTVQYQENKEGLAGARKGAKIFWTEVLTPGSANFIYLSSEKISQKESFLPSVDQPIVESSETRPRISLLGDLLPLGAKLPNLVVRPSLADFDDLSLLGQIAQAAIIPSEIKDLLTSPAQFSAGQSSQLTAGLSDKLSQKTLSSPFKPLVILLISIILSSFLFALSLVSWRKRLSR